MAFSGFLVDGWSDGNVCAITLEHASQRLLRAELRSDRRLATTGAHSRPQTTEPAVTVGQRTDIERLTIEGIAA